MKNLIYLIIFINIALAITSTLVYFDTSVSLKYEVEEYRNADNQLQVSPQINTLKDIYDRISFICQVVFWVAIVVIGLCIMVLNLPLKL
jgi:hypothetical protein